MFFPTPIVDIQIIHKHFKKSIKVGSKNFYHGPGECIGYIFHAKRHDYPIEKSSLGDQCRLADVF
jgi:hypothetical protein